MRGLSSPPCPNCSLTSILDSGRLGHQVVVLLDAIDAACPVSKAADKTCAAARQATEAVAAIPCEVVAPEQSHGSASSLISLTLCSASWLRPGDEVACITLVTSIFMSTRWLGRMLLEASATPTTDASDDANSLRRTLFPIFARLLHTDAAVLSQARARAAHSPTEVASLSPSMSSSPLPLAVDWLVAPCHTFPADGSESVRAQRVMPRGEQ